MNISRLLIATCTFAFFLISNSANATLVSRLGGQAVYDTDLEITWLADANYLQSENIDVDGLVMWDDAISWVRTFTFEGYDQWRLPEMPANGCTQLGCTDGEMGHLYWVEFWDGSGGLSESQLSKFKNIEAGAYWYQTDLGTQARAFWFNNGFQGSLSKTNEAYVWAVADGDVFVPLPATLWLFGSGLLGLAGIVRKRAN